MIVTTDGADEIEPAANGRSLRVVWRRWALVGSKSGQLLDPHITSEVIWHLDGSSLTRDETLRSTEGLILHRWWVALPTTAAVSEMSVANGQCWDTLHLGESSVAVAARADWPLEMSLLATEDSALGRGARGPVPLHLIYESRDLRLAPNRNAHWCLIMKLAAAGQMERMQLAPP